MGNLEKQMGRPHLHGLNFLSQAHFLKVSSLSSRLVAKPSTYGLRGFFKIQTMIYVWLRKARGICPQISQIAIYLIFQFQLL